ncbi:MAG TPA: alpha/beta hydrolase [Acidimicrobiia bacterium]|nr:alpha/beta hydrolase [Acidimicrobiia bacterium]
MTAVQDASVFDIERSEVRNGVSLAYVHEGRGGAPLLLIHGWPETKRIWWRNIAPLTEAGFEVIAPDLRGFGDSDLAPDNFYDVSAYSLDMYALVHDVLGHDHCAVAGGDLGGVILYDLALRYPGFVERLCFFNTLVPLTDELYEAAGIPPDPPHDTRQTADYFRRQGTEPDALLAELDTPERRRAWVAAMYGHRLWAAPGHFTREDVAFMAEPFADPDKLRASWGAYETAYGNREMEDVPRLFEPCPVPALVLYGPDDHVVPKSFPDRCRVAFPEIIGPFVVPDAGHFLQWEQADTFNQALRYFLA